MNNVNFSEIGNFFLKREQIFFCKAASFVELEMGDLENSFVLSLALIHKYVSTLYPELQKKM